MKIFFLVVFVVKQISWATQSAQAPLSIGIIQEWSAFNPITSQLASNSALFPFILRDMVKKSPDGKVLPDIAEKIPPLKKKSALWLIKKNAKWADGQDITCADWFLGWQAGLNPKTSVATRNIYEKIINIEWDKQKPKACRVTYASTDWSYERDLPPFLPPLEKSIFEKFKNEPEGYDRNTNYISAPTNKSLCNGPYYVSEFKLGRHIILTRNEHFYGAKPKIENIIIRHIADSSALKASLLSGQINVISAVGFPPDTALMLDEEFKKTKSMYKVRFQNSGIFQGLFFNLDNEILKDIRVREALSRTINKEQIVTAFFNNNLQAAEGILSPQHPAFTPNASIYSKNKAIKLLDEAGWKIATNGVREKSGKPLILVFKTSAGLKILESIQVYICEQFKSIGVLCSIKNEPPRILLGQSVPHGEFDLTMHGLPTPPDTSITSSYSSQDIPTAQNSWTGGNTIRLHAKELDQLLFSFDKEADQQKRNTLIKKIELYLQKNYVMIPLYHRREAIVIPHNLTGVTDSFEGTSFANPEDWVLK